MNTTTVPYQSRSYKVSISRDTTWEDAISSIVIKNSKNQFVYKKHDDGNRVAVLVNALYKQGKTVYVEHNGTQYIYIEAFDVFVSRATKKICWKDKSNPQRIELVYRAHFHS